MKVTVEVDTAVPEDAVNTVFCVVPGVNVSVAGLAVTPEGSPVIATATVLLKELVANLARHVKTDPESALRGCNAKFERRFHHIERELQRRGKALGEVSLDEMDALWDKAKALETT